MSFLIRNVPPVHQKRKRKGRNFLAFRVQRSHKKRSSCQPTSMWLMLYKDHLSLKKMNTGGLEERQEELRETGHTRSVSRNWWICSSPDGVSLFSHGVRIGCLIMLESSL